jgi:hypothetical protein
VDFYGILATLKKIFESMDRDIILQALQEMTLRDGKSLKEVQQYLRMRYRVEVDDLVLKRRLEIIDQTEKAVA